MSIDPPPWVGLALVWTFILGGVTFLVGAIITAWSMRRFLSRAVRTRGIVTRVDLELSDVWAGDVPKINRDIYRPVVIFSTESGERVEFKATCADYPPAYAAGAVVPVLYDQNNPGNACIHSFSELWLGSVFLGGMGMVLTPLGVFLLLSGLVK